MRDTVAVLGGGPGGMAVAAHIASLGHAVRLFELPQFAANFDPVRSREGIEVFSDLRGRQLVSLDLVTTDISEALRGAAAVYCVVPCFGHQVMAELALPHLTSGQIFCYSGEGGGSLVFRRAQQNMNVKVDVLVGEMNTLPFLARPIGPGVISVRSKPGAVLAAALPHRRTPVLVEQLKRYWSFLEPAETVYETILLNFNAMDHVATVLTNIGTVEGRRTPMLLWGEGATPSVVRCIEGVDNEILSIRRALGLRRTQVYREWLALEGFTQRVYETTYEAIHASVLEGSLFACGPDALQSRYITEDVPYALVLISTIARALGIQTPLIDAFVTIASVAHGVDYWSTGRTIGKLGFSGRGREALLDFVS